MDATILDRIPTALTNIAQGLEPAMVAAALSVLGITFMFQLSWGLAENLLRKASIGDFAAFFVKELVVVGTFAGLARNGADLANWIIGSFQNSAAQASGFSGTMAPSGVISTALGLGNGLLKSASIWNAPEVYLFAAVIIGAFAVIAGLIVLALAEAAFVVYGGLLWLGFGGSRWTREMALSTIRYVFSVGAKLFTMQLIVGFGSMYTMQAIGDFNNVETTGLASSDCVVAACVSIVMLLLALRLPETVQSFVAGSSLTGMSSLMSAVGFMSGATAMAAGAVMSTAGAGAMAKNAYQLTAANREAKMAATGAQPGAAKRITSQVTGTIGNTIKSLAGTEYSRAGALTPQRGSRLIQAAVDTGHKARQQKADNQSPRSNP